MKADPAWTPAVLRRHPALLVEWLQFANPLSIAAFAALATVLQLRAGAKT